ncbi:Scr1 family TA system antitoxin-like transcriptional regulator [Nonomuraea sp. NPDC049152]|uniref:Scr1 family TA system antitoxin-like transcriptional regulator n=1 Tax=Nonomuraea sp. NPDC049152 TaxID=3154350 RepID=UPI0033D6E8C5
MSTVPAHRPLKTFVPGQVCGVSPQRTNELLAEQQSTAGMWVTYQRLNRAGLRQARASVRPIYDRTSLVRAYQSRTFPGLIQTAGFTTTVLQQVRIRQGVQIDDVTAAVAERMDRQRASKAVIVSASSA